MALRINCPACKTVNVVDDEKRGKKIRCKKCEKPIVVPAEKSKRDDTQAIQDARKTKLKMAASSHNRNDEDDAEEDEERPTKKQKTNTAKKKGAFPVMLVVGGIGALLFLLLLGGGTAGYFFFIRKSDTPPNDPGPIAKVENNKNDGAVEAKKDGDKKEDAKTDPTRNKKTDPEPTDKKKDDDKIEPKKEPEPEAKKKPDPVTPPVPDPKKEPEPEPKKKVDPLPKVFPPPNPIIDELPTDILQRVKRATVSIQTTMPTGKRIDGSGFLVAEKGIIVTNAEVVGTGISASAPNVIQVGLTGGDGKLRTVPAQLVGVDPVNRLAILRVNGADLSKPLELSKNPAPGLGQTVFVGGPKPAAKPGPEIIVRPAIAFGFRKFADGMFDLVNLRTGMGPASAGGPIVDIEGNVVAIAISGNAVAPESSATPVLALRLILDGRLNEPAFGMPYVSAQLGRPVVPVKISTLDPLGRIKEMKVEIWAGPPGPPRSASAEMPIAAVGDGPITAQTVKLPSGQGNIDMPFPAGGPGQVIWVRSVGTNIDGGASWGPAVAMSGDVIPVDRRAASLVLNPKGESIRTVSLRTTGRVTTLLPSAPGSVFYFESEYKADMVELYIPEFSGATLRGAFGNVIARVEVDGKIDPTAGAGIDLFRMIPPTFSIFPNNKLKPQPNRDVTATISPPSRSSVERHYSAIFSSLEAAMIPLPMRVVQPLETFPAQVSYMLRAGKSPQFADIDLLCKLEGTRTRNARVEAVVSMTGKMKGRDLSTRDSAGDVTGHFAFDLTGGYLSQVHMNIASDLESKTGMVGNVLNFGIDVSRIPGNPMNIPMQTDPKKVSDPKIPNPKDPTPKGAKTIFTTQGALLPTGPINPKSKLPPTGPPKSVTVQRIRLEMGKSYTVMVFANTFNAQIKLEDATGLPAGQNDKVPGNNARITVRPMQSGFYRVVISSTKGSGQFQVVVQEVP
ncbi:MAG: hypothetical protein EXS16_14055 [Gemmataceae bacterium]|nr:hypothetical protein [Gemmataceae bacterium]